MTFFLGTLLLTIVTALACALPGVFIVLRKQSMLIDAMSHAVLPGIVFGFALTHSLESPLMILFAAAAIMVVVLVTEWLASTKLITGDAPIGLVFPALFSIGIICITLNFSNVHLDAHAALVGDINLAAFEQLSIGGIELGPSFLYTMSVLFILQIIFIVLLYPKLQLTSFDENFAQTLGVRIRLLRSTFMFLLSITVTAAFYVAGAVLVLAFVVVPAASALLLCNRLSQMIVFTLCIAVVGAIAGFMIAYELNAATSAGISVCYGVIFFVVFAVAGGREARRRRRAQRTPKIR